MNVSARADYALRAMLALAAEPPPGIVKGDALATSQDLPLKFLETILVELRRAGLVASRRGGDGGYWLAKPGTSVTVAAVMAAVDGPVMTVRRGMPDALTYHGPAMHLGDVWSVASSAITSVFEGITLADVVAGKVKPSRSDGRAARRLAPAASGRTRRATPA